MPRSYRHIQEYEKEIIELKNNEDTPDEELPMCTDEERWRDPTKYAVKKKTNKTYTILE